MLRRSAVRPHRRGSRRPVRLALAGLGATALSAGLVAVDASPAAATDKPVAQAVGRFLDGSLAGMSLEEAVADLKDARAVNPGTPSAQNPLEANLLGQVDVPIGDALKLPDPSGTFSFGAVNQVAVAKSDGYSYGASGAVSNSGGISVGGADGFPANATISLSADSIGTLLGGIPTLPIPTLPGLDALPDAGAIGSVSAQIGAVSALAQTKSGGDAVAPQYRIAGLGLTIESPALGALLNQLGAGGDALSGALADVFAGLPDALKGLLPAACTAPITGGQLPDTISIPSDGPHAGAIVIDPAHAKIVIDVEKILGVLDLNLNDLPANTDLLGYLLGQLPKLLTGGLGDLVGSLVNTLKDAGQACLDGVTNIDLGGLPLGPVLDQLLATLTTQQGQLEDALDAIGTQLTSATADPISMLTGALAQALAIGVNIQSGPGKIADNATHRFSTALGATPNQATAAVADQTLVRAVEVDLGGSGGVALALGNAAAGPSTPAVAPPTSASPTPQPTTPPPATAIPTGVPAGLADTDAGTPVLPVVLLALGVLMAAGGVASWRRRGSHIA